MRILLVEEAEKTEVSPTIDFRGFGKRAEISKSGWRPGFRKHYSRGPFYSCCLLGIETCSKNSIIYFKLRRSFAVFHFFLKM